MEYNLYIRYILKKSKVNSEGKAPINIRLTLNGKRVELSTNKYVDIDRWDSKANKLKGNREDSRTLNNYLDNTKASINRKFNLFVDIGNDFTIDDLKNEILDKSKNTKTLLEFFDYHLDNLKGKVNKGFSNNTIKSYTTVKNRLETFIKKEYAINDILLTKLNYSFVSGFEIYLKKEFKCAHNTTMKYIKQLKAVIHRAIDFEYIEKDPFTKFKCSYEETNRSFLTQEEIDRIINKPIVIHRLDKVRDIFIFCCYTGLSYSDVEKLTTENIVIGINGEKWINTYRSKTNVRTSIPILPQALKIIEKYSDYPENNNKGKLLPVNSNQKLNQYLKEIADICNITKHLTLHVSRHSFASTILLSNGIPITTTSKLLAHSSLKTTSIYAKVVDTTIAKEMKELEEKLSSQADKADENNMATG